jgi:hypothetical protein
MRMGICRINKNIAKNKQDNSNIAIAKGYILSADAMMEVCSISRRTDFPQKARYENKQRAVVEKDILVLEIAIGLDRCVYNWAIAEEKG